MDTKFGTKQQLEKKIFLAEFFFEIRIDVRTTAIRIFGRLTLIKLFQVQFWPRKSQNFQILIKQFFVAKTLKFQKILIFLQKIAPSGVF